MRNLIIAILCVFLPGCWFGSGPEVVVYVALDREFSEPILQQWESETGIDVLANFDIESTKSVGLTSQIMAEQNRPRCDLFWNNEILNTLRLEKQGLLDVYVSPRAAEFPAQFVSPKGHWHGLAARVRVLIVNTDLMPPGERPESILDLTDPRWRGKVGIAKPLAGTTATHAACLFDAWGEERAKAFFHDVKENAVVLSGNSQVAQAVANGELLFGLTDTDDAYKQQVVHGKPVAIIFPDQGAEQMGALFIPNTLAIVKHGPNTEHARLLVDYLLSAEVEEQLAASYSAQFPLNQNATKRSPVAPEEPLKRMEVDFSSAADHWTNAAEFLTGLFVSVN